MPDNGGDCSLTDDDFDDFETAHHPVDLITKRLDSLDENLFADDDVRKVGFIGMGSEVRWLQAVAAIHPQQAEKAGLTSQAGPYAPCNDSTSSFYYWSVSESVHDMDLVINPHELPPLVLAEKLISCYMDTVHDSFPILSRKLFKNQFRQYYTALQGETPPRLSSKWQANLNLVFAIGARHLFLVKAAGHTNECDHLVYQARAKAFYADDSLATSLADVAQIQSLALHALFYTCVGQVSR